MAPLGGCLDRRDGLNGQDVQDGFLLPDSLARQGYGEAGESLGVAARPPSCQALLDEVAIAIVVVGRAAADRDLGLLGGLRASSRLPAMVGMWADQPQDLVKGKANACRHRAHG